MTDHNNGVSDPPGLMTIDEVAAFLQVSKNTIYGWRHHRKGPSAVRLGKHLRFKRKNVLGWIEQLEREQGQVRR
jgi:excisionase family DNA binding protein